MTNELKITDKDIERLNCLQWTKANRIVKSKIELRDVPFSIDTPPYVYPFLKEIYYNRCVGGPRHLVIMKPRQIGATEFAINSAFYANDVFSANVIYCLPGQSDLRKFSGARINEIIRTSPKIRSLFSSTDNLELKVGRNASIHLKGMQSEAGLEETPADYVIRDEIDQMPPANAAMILEALGGSFLKWILDLSHPTYPGKGIHESYRESSQGTWMFICPHCGAKQNLSWEGNVDVTNYCYKCAQCYKRLEKKDFWSGFYEHKIPDHRVRGFQFNQIMSPTVDLEDQIIKWNLAQGIPYKMRIFHNTVLGLPYAENSKKLTEESVRDLMKDQPHMAFKADESVFGLDVGSGLHLWVQSGENMLTVALLDDWGELDKYVDRYNPKCVVIDAGPEGHAAKTMVEELRKKGIDAWMCMRSDGLAGHRVIDDNTMTIKVNKTEQFDEFYARLLGMNLPSNLPQEAIDQLVAPVRTYRTAPDGSKKGIWDKGICHFADSGSYAMEAAKQMESHYIIPKDIIVPQITGKSRWKGRLTGDGF